MSVKDAVPAPLAAVLLLAGALLAPQADVGAGTRRSLPELADAIDVVVLPRRIIAVGAGDGSVEEPLALREEVLWTRSEGGVAVAVTDRRILTVAVDASVWRETRLQLLERRRVEAELGERVALVVTPKRLLGFGAHAPQVAERSIGPNETLVLRRVSEAVAVVLTDREVLGLSALGGGFVAADLRIHEEVESVRTSARSASVRTSQRLLVFDALSLTWSEEDIPLY